MDRAHGRDEAIERLLRQSLRTPQDAAEPGPACLDAGTLAAWFDGDLEGASLESAQAHASTCARCRTLVSAMARTSAAADAEAAAARVAAAKAANRERRLPLRWLAWAAPLSAAAVAIVIWAVVPGERTPAPVMNEVERQAAVVRAPESARTPETVAPGTAGETAALAARSTDDLPAAAPASPGQIANEAQAPTPQRELRRDALADQAGARAASEPPAAVGSARAAPSAPAESSPDARARQEQTLPGVESFAKAAETVASVPIIVLSPDPSIRWRLVGSLVERSTNGGANWDTVTGGIDQPLTAGSAPSPTTCWVVGRGGTVLRSTDGRTFSRVSFPETTDLTAVQASDAQSAMVTTADGRLFVTSNAGASWRSR